MHAFVCVGNNILYHINLVSTFLYSRLCCVPFRFYTTKFNAFGIDREELKVEGLGLSHC